MRQVAQQTVLILLDQGVEHVRIAPAQPCGDLGLFRLHRDQRTECCGDHTTGIYEPGREKDSGGIPKSDSGRMNAFPRVRPGATGEAYNGADFEAREGISSSSLRMVGTCNGSVAS